MMNKMNTMNNRNVNSSEAMPTKIVGAVWVENPRPWWVPAGLESTQGPGAKPPAYRMVSFGAEREWKNDDEGWQLYETRRQRKSRRRLARGNNDTYDFDDSY
jgi:hypothetical protein